MFKLCAFFAFVPALVCVEESEIEIGGLAEKGDELAKYFESKAVGWGLVYSPASESALENYLKCRWNGDDRTNSEDGSISEVTIDYKICMQKYGLEGTMLHGSFEKKDANSKEDIITAVRNYWNGQEKEQEDPEDLENLKGRLKLAKEEDAGTVSCAYLLDKDFLDDAYPNGEFEDVVEVDPGMGDLACIFI